jgi:hypothetical protein
VKQWNSVGVYETRTSFLRSPVGMENDHGVCGGRRGKRDTSSGFSRE